MNEFFYMGGYAGSVWSAYLITLVVLGLNVFITRRMQRRLKNKIKQEAVE